MPNENDERERGAAAIQTQREEANEKSGGMRSTLNPPSGLNAVQQRKKTMDELSPTVQSDVPLENRDAAAARAVELVTDTQEKGLAASGGAHHAATGREVVDKKALARPQSVSPKQRAEEKPPAFAPKPKKEKTSPSSDAGTSKSSKHLGRNEGRRTKKPPGTGSPKATASNDDPDPKPAFLLKHQLFHHPRHKKMPAAESPCGVKAAATTSTGEGTRASNATSTNRPVRGPALDPSLKRKLIEGPESSIVVEGSVAQHVLNRIGKLRHEAVPSSALYGTEDDGRTKEVGDAVSPLSEAANLVTLREVVWPASSHDEPLLRVTAGLYRGFIGKWMRRWSSQNKSRPTVPHTLSRASPHRCRDRGR
jgi:hypothetical protein